MLRTQPNAWIELAALVVVFGLAWAFQVSGVEWALLAVTIFGVLAFEALNTAIEAVVDLVSPEYHPLARIAKDTAAGALDLRCDCKRDRCRGHFRPTHHRLVLERNLDEIHINYEHLNAKERRGKANGRNSKALRPIELTVRIVSLLDFSFLASSRSLRPCVEIADFTPIQV